MEESRPGETPVYEEEKSEMLKREDRVVDSAWAMRDQRRLWFDPNLDLLG